MLQTIPGINDLSAAIILIEIGGSKNFLKAFSTGDNFAGWIGFCPGNNSSNNKRTGRKGRKGNKYLRRILCESAQAASRTKGSTLKSKYQSIKIRLGFKRSIVAIAHKIARLIFFVLQHHNVYIDPQVNYQEISCKRNMSRWLKQMMKCKDVEITATDKRTGVVYDSKTTRKFDREQKIGELRNTH